MKRRSQPAAKTRERPSSRSAERGPKTRAVAKRGRRKERPPRPDWFDLSTDRPPLRFRLTSEDLADVARLWTDASLRPALEGFHRLFLGEVCAVLQRLPQSSGWELMTLLVYRNVASAGPATFLPKEFVATDDERRQLFTQALEFVALQSFRAWPTQRNPIFRAAVWTVCGFLGGDGIAREVDRRGAAHIGVAAGGLLARSLLLQKLGLDAAPGEKGDAATIAVELLARGRRRAPTPADKRQEIISQALETLQKEWGDLDPLEVMARAFDGQMNIARRAIVHDLADEQKHDARAEGKDSDQLEVILNERPELGDVQTPEEYARLAQLVASLEAHPLAARLREAMWGGDATDSETKQATADRLGVSRMTLHEWRGDVSRHLET